MKRIIYALVVLLLAIPIFAQQSGTPSTLRVKIDANGYLVTAIAAQTNPVTTQTFNNARLKVDSSGSLVVVVAGGGGAPSDGPYITYTSSASLTSEQNLGALTTGLLLNTVSAGSATLTSLGSTLPFANGGLGFAIATAGDIFYASATNTSGKLSDVAVGQLLASGGVGVIPAYSAIPAISGFKPTADSTTAFNIYKANGTTALFVFDTSNGRFAQGKATAPSYAIDSNDNQNAVSRLSITNSTVGAGSAAMLQAASDTFSAQVEAFSSTFTSSGNNVANHGLLVSGYLDVASSGNNPIDFWSNGVKVGSLSSAGRWNGTAGYSINTVLWNSGTAPTIASGGCTSPAVTHSNGTAAFLLTVGSSCTGVKTIVLTMPASAHFWHVQCDNNTSDAQQASNYLIGRATSTTAVTLTSYDRVTGVTEDVTAADTYLCSAAGE